MILKFIVSLDLMEDIEVHGYFSKAKRPEDLASSNYI